MESLSTKSSLPAQNSLPPQKVAPKKDPASLNLSIILNKYERKYPHGQRLEKKVDIQSPSSGNLQSITEAANLTPPARRTSEIENRMRNIFNVLCKYMNRLKSPVDGMKAFNKNVDKIKASTPDWREHLLDNLKDLTNEEVLSIIDMPLVHLRGYDRDFLHAIYTAINDNVDRDQLTADQLKKLEAGIAHFKTLIIEVPVEDMKLIGSGAINKVHVIKYKDENGVEKEGVFKPDLDKMPTFLRLKEANFGAASASGIIAGKKGFYSDRSVIFSKIDKYLGFNISVDTEFAIVNGTRGILMSKANPGKIATTGFTKKTIHSFNPDRQHNLPVEKKDAHTQDFVNNYIKEKMIAGDGTLSKRDLNFLGSIYGCRDVQLEKDEEGWIIVGNFPKFENFDYNNPKTMDGLIKLQLLDYIMGQVDRHPYNLNIDKDGSVKGFDNDAAFGAKVNPKNLDDMRDQPALAYIIPNNSSLMLRPPNVVTLEMCDQVNNLCAHADALQAYLKDFLNEDEIQGVSERLAHLHKHMNYSALVVKDMEDLVSLDAIERMDSNNSYAELILKHFDSSIEGWNYLRAHRDMPQFPLE